MKSPIERYEIDNAISCSTWYLGKHGSIGGVYGETSGTNIFKMNTFLK